ncbi:mucin-associated surface protein (MASP), putative [Trypanosoma cruzi marinkellei]|uniref:Mucin-associated surface protein (MASP), putative n=1 Tax=Trypanosoma cruzi marinkellei TaxID=85056 RepID=K2LYC6_TRYCR|nr:mucin-associated surface protein (MASP), putative [Trypanosoma cruzi marinkellei]
MKELCNDGYAKLFMETEDSNFEGICTQYAGEPDDANKCPRPQTKLLLDADALSEVPHPEVPLKEEEREKTSEEAPTVLAGALPGTAAGAALGYSTAKPTEVSSSPPVEGQPEKADGLPLPHSVEGSVSMKPTNNSTEEDIVPTTDNKQDETPNGEAESTTPTFQLPAVIMVRTKRTAALQKIFRTMHWNPMSRGQKKKR